MQIKVLEVKRINGYIEINYEMTLDYTAAQQTALGQTTKKVNGIAAFSNGTSVNAIKSEMVSRLNAAQNELTNDTTYQYYGVTYNGTSWSA